MVTVKKLRPVLVEWHDILDGGGEWQDDDGKLAPVTVRTVGFMLSKGPKHITIARDYFDHEDKRTLGGRLAIPTGCIVKITQLG